MIKGDLYDTMTTPLENIHRQLCRIANVLENIDKKIGDDIVIEKE